MHSRRTRTATMVIAAVLIVSVLLFLRFQYATLLLGDGQLVSTTVEGMVSADARTLDMVHDVLTSNHISPGTSILYFIFAKTLNAVSGILPTAAIRVLNSLLGSALVGLLLIIAWRSTLRLELCIWLVILTLFSGAVQLFFGYVEDYSPLMFVGAVYVIAAIRYVHGKGSLWTLAAIALFATFLHIQGILLGPSFALLVAWRYLVTGREASLRVVTLSIMALVAIAAYIAGVHTGLRQYFLPLLPLQEGLAVLSPAHLVDILNEFLIVMPAIPLFVLLAMVTARSPAKAESTKTKDSDGWMTLTIEWHFSWLVLFPYLVYLVFLDPQIGMSRDWDLFSFII
jgi:hypothetical protein